MAAPDSTSTVVGAILAVGLAGAAARWWVRRTGKSGAPEDRPEWMKRGGPDMKGPPDGAGGPGATEGR